MSTNSLFFSATCWRNSCWDHKICVPTLPGAAAHRGDLLLLPALQNIARNNVKYVTVSWQMGWTQLRSKAYGCSNSKGSRWAHALSSSNLPCAGNNIPVPGEFASVSTISLMWILVHPSSGFICIVPTVCEDICVSCAQSASGLV